MMRGKAKGIGLVGYLSAGLSGVNAGLSAEASLTDAGYLRPTKTNPANTWFGRYKKT